MKTRVTMPTHTHNKGIKTEPSGGGVQKYKSCTPIVKVIHPELAEYQIARKCTFERNK